MSDAGSPRVDDIADEAKNHDPYALVIGVDDAHSLERELIAAKTRIAELEKALRDIAMLAANAAATDTYDYDD